LIIFNKTSFL